MFMLGNELDKSKVEVEGLRGELGAMTVAYDESQAFLVALNTKYATVQLRQRHGESQKLKAYELLQAVRRQSERRAVKAEGLEDEQAVLLSRLAELESGFGALVNEPGDALGSATRALSKLSLRRSASSAATIASPRAHASPTKPPPPPRLPPAAAAQRSRPSPQEAHPSLPPEPSAESPKVLLAGLDYGVPTKLDLYAPAAAPPQAASSPQGLGRLRKLEPPPEPPAASGASSPVKPSPTKRPTKKRPEGAEASGGAAAEPRSPQQPRRPVSFTRTATAEVHAGVGSVTEVALGLPRAGVLRESKPRPNDAPPVAAPVAPVAPTAPVVPGALSVPSAGSTYLDIGRAQGSAEGSREESPHKSRGSGYLASGASSGAKPSRGPMQLSAEPLPPIDRDPGPQRLATVGDPRLSLN